MHTLQLLVEHGVETPDGFQKLAPGRLTASTVNRHLRRLGFDHERMIRQPPRGLAQSGFNGIALGRAGGRDRRAISQKPQDYNVEAAAVLGTT